MPAISSPYFVFHSQLPLLLLSVLHLCFDVKSSHLGNIFEALKPAMQSDVRIKRGPYLDQCTSEAIRQVMHGGHVICDSVWESNTPSASESPKIWRTHNVYVTLRMSRQYRSLLKDSKDTYTPSWTSSAKTELHPTTNRSLLRNKRSTSKICGMAESLLTWLENWLHSAEPLHNSSTIQKHNTKHNTSGKK